MSIAVAVLALTALWHAAAAWHFTLFPHRTLGRSTSQRPVNDLAAELFRFLGGLNIALVALGAIACFVPPARPVAAAVLALANATQFVQDVRVKRLGFARGGFFTQILVGDAIFAVANLAVAVATACWPKH